MAFGFRLRQRDRFAFLFQVRQCACFFQRPHFGGGAIKSRFQRDLVGALALTVNSDALAFAADASWPSGARVRGARRSASAAMRASAEAMPIISSLAACTAATRSTACKRACSVCSCNSSEARAACSASSDCTAICSVARLRFSCSARARSSAAMRISLSASTRARNSAVSLLHRFQTGHARLRGGAHGFQAFAVGGDGVFGGLCILLCSRSGSGIDGGAVFSQ